ncbi:MAG: hypothetical protein CK427_11265 [Leptospira sp.]|nr:MAG: hypothetical protein CK427_11265 [Leptospira sp.]
MSSHQYFINVYTRLRKIHSIDSINSTNSFFYRVISIMLLLLFVNTCSSLSEEERKDKLIQIFLSTFESSKSSKSAVLLIHSDTLNLHTKASAGEVKNKNDYLATNVDQPFHIASVGKLFTATLIFKEIESNKLKLHDKVASILGKESLRGLFVFKNVDYSHEVTIAQLLNHTSGVDDYFESTSDSKKGLIHEIISEPNRFWTPQDLIEYTKTHQSALSRPGTEFHYSDTGYVLLGLVLEKINRKPFEQILEQKIFQPIKLKHTYMHLRSKPQINSSLSLSPIFLMNQDVTNFQSISADWAGGGLISTTEDLLKFMKALTSSKIISKESYNSMKGNYKFLDGIQYGYGLMNVKFGEMSILIPNIANLEGHSGILGTHLFYIPEFDTTIVANFGSSEDIDSSYEMLYWILSELQSINTIHQKSNNQELNL